MTSSVEGLMTSKVLPSTALMNSLLIKLFHVLEVAGKSGAPEDRSLVVSTYRPVGWSYSPVWGVLIFTESPDMIVIANWVSEKTKCE